MRIQLGRSKTVATSVARFGARQGAVSHLGTIRQKNAETSVGAEPFSCRGTVLEHGWLSNRLGAIRKPMDRKRNSHGAIQ